MPLCSTLLGILLQGFDGEKSGFLLFIRAGVACRPAITLTSVARAVKVWSSNVESVLGSLPKEESISSRFQELKLSTNFMAEAAINLVKLTSHIMAHSVTAKWAPWLKHWSVDSASKQGLCSIPFTRGTLFCKTLEDVIRWVIGGKYGLLPQVQRRRMQPFRSNRKSRDQFKNASSYHPGREFNQFPWCTRGSFADQAKPKYAKSSKMATKSFLSLVHLGFTCRVKASSFWQSLVGKDYGCMGSDGSRLCL